MAVPKKRLTHRRIKNRRSQKHGKVELKSLSLDQASGKPALSHRMRLDSGYYKGKKIIAKL
jgi:ribosomal protein L32